MTKAWAQQGLDDFQSWLGATVYGEGLIYRGDADFEQLGPRGKLTVIEFKKQHEKPVGRGQLAWLRVRARQEKTEVRIVRELTEDYDNPDRPVWVWNPVEPAANAQEMTLSHLAAWVDSRAYRPAQVS
ncbi:hypothetical protein SEA_ALBRIGHT_29 [Microbacterium phage Albright]|uniref:hypothetical protein n=1 Tax=Microbacterium phage IndyLu TaxID=2885152 RepID=UPI0010C4065B|nr:hypothetical protein QDW27_gp30 [Microbacterium phage IndyLu]YP_010753043.1 hypothetical protein QDW28_gp29 [Microbacterium phage Albright]YP_010753872.1 hypothetical protein QDW44_gp30 [Microbacterium phage BubbaBear]WNO26453.1 hypothetical protein SEA_BABYDAISY_30 [Microbacterium phage BabyDaisy]QCG77291.1 hypothetical protein SEA_BUBBABEAR_30 [Microbacterium phage BubbaBear]QTF82204.1 hypothetical protein SEA_ALBRIGHT_29 [Microbacterium phage Albright]UDG78732.1 hypothetical protein SEA